MWLDIQRRQQFQEVSEICDLIDIVLIQPVTFIGYCLGNIVGPLCFTSTPGPDFAGGFISCVVVMICIILLAIFGRWHLGRENKRRDEKYGSPSREHALDDLTDRENKDFRYML
jgi:hypothetical protein